MTALVLAIILTLGVSAVCSLLEAFILSISVAEIESLKRAHSRLGKMLEGFKVSLDETSSAILTLNTIANTAGATVVGILAGNLFANDEFAKGALAVGMVVGILFISEIIPKNLGVAYRKQLLPILPIPLKIVRIAMWPLSKLAKFSVTFFVRTEKPSEEEQTQEILLLADRSAKQGALSKSERDLISNALSLDDIRVEDIMTPRTVVTSLHADLTVGDAIRDFKNIPFARMPVYEDNIDHIVGLVRRREILEASSEDREDKTMRDLMMEIPFIPENASALQAMQLFLQQHQQLALVVDEFGSTVGVVTMEDVIEHLLGKEIYEESDVAIDMREFARKQAAKVPPVTEVEAAAENGEESSEESGEEESETYAARGSASER